MFPVDCGHLTVRDLLDIAFVPSLGVPLYRRRYPLDLFDFACDIFFEKPVLIVQHHADFINGFDPLLSFVHHLHEIKPDIKWRPLGALLAESSWQRLDKNGSVQIRTLLKEAHHPISAEKNYSTKEWMKIAIRRYLCEFRDNHISHSRAFKTLQRAILERTAPKT